MASTVFYSFAKAMFKSSTGNIEIPNYQSPQLNYIFELPFEFRIAVAFIGTWVGFVAFDHVTDIIGRKFVWLLGLIACGFTFWIVKQYVGIGPSSEDIVALFDEDREAVTEVMSKNWKPITSNEVLKQAVGKSIALQWVSQQYGNLYLTDEKKPYFTFAKKIEHAGEFQLIPAPFEDGVDTVAFFSESRRLYITNTLLGYLKVEAPRMGAWEMYQLDFNSERGKISDTFQLRSVSRGRHLMHLREGNFHKGFHDKYGEVAMFRMFYYDPSNIAQVEGASVTADILTTQENSSQLSSDKSELSDSSSDDISDKIGSSTGWKVIAKEDRIPSRNPIVIYLHNEGFLEANQNGDIKLTNSIEGATKFQICQIPNATAIAFFSRSHGRYLTLGGLFVSKLRVEGSKFENWEKFKITFDKEQPTNCCLKVLKTWPPPTIMRSHLLDKNGKSKKAVFSLLYNELQTL